MARGQLVPVPRAVDVEALYRAYVQRIYAFIYSRVGNRQTAEDLTSEVFLRTLTHVDPTRTEQSIVAWLYRVARNVLNDSWRARRGIKMISLEQVWEFGFDLPGPAPCHQQQTTRHAQEVLRRLPENYRMVLQHRILEGLSVEETAARMATSASNVKVLQHRALKRAAALQEDKGGHE